MSYFFLAKSLFCFLIGFKISWVIQGFFAKLNCFLDNFVFGKCLLMMSVKPFVNFSKLSASKLRSLEFMSSLSLEFMAHDT